MNNEEHYQQFFEEVRQRKIRLKSILTEILRTDKIFKTLEIGSGHGDFLVNYARNFPERFCLGLDLITQRVEKSRKKACRENLLNCLFLKARAEEFLKCQSPEFLWNEVIILYPDPWPKTKHHKNRLFQIDFLTQLAKVVVPGAKIHFETDHVEYFKEVCKCVLQHPQWQQVNAESYVVDTVFSRITGQQGNHAVFEKIT